MSGDILTVKTVKRVRSVRGSALVHIKPGNPSRTRGRAYLFHVFLTTTRNFTEIQRSNYSIDNDNL